MKPYCFSLPERSLKNKEGTPPDWCDECDHFIECQEAYEFRPLILTLNLKSEFYYQIESGEKKNEFRDFKPIWKKRLIGRHYNVIEICRGYPEKGDLENRMWFIYQGYHFVFLRYHPVTGEEQNIPYQMFSIPLSNRLDYPYQAIEKRRLDA